MPLADEMLRMAPFFLKTARQAGAFFLKKQITSEKKDVQQTLQSPGNKKKTVVCVLAC